jgi:hypothetical protein
MADVKISELTALTSPDGAEELVVNDGGTTKKITIDNATTKVNYGGVTKLAATSSGVDVTGTVTADVLDVSGASTVRSYLTNTGLANTGEKACFQWDTNANLSLQGRDSTTGFKANWYTIETSAADGYADNHIFYTGASSEKMRISADGNLGLGVVPEAWSGVKALQILSASFMADASTRHDSMNAYFDSAGWKYAATAGATNFYQSGGAYVFRVAPSGTADSAISWTTAMTIDNSGNVGIGTANPDSTLHLKSSATNLPVLKLENLNNKVHVVNMG